MKAPVLDSSATAVAIREKMVVCDYIQNGACALARARVCGCTSTTLCRRASSIQSTGHCVVIILY